MTSFVLAAAALAAVALLLLLRPWWRRDSNSVAADAVGAMNAAIHRDRLAELERDRLAGIVSEQDLAEARDELTRQLLDDAANAAPPAAPVASRRSGLAIAILVPLLAVVLYAVLGNPAALLSETAREQRAAGEMEDLVAKLAAKLERNPANPEGWAMLARSYKSLQRWDDALRAFDRVGPELDKNAELLAEVAETLVQKNQGFDDRSRDLIRRSLKLEPDNMLALFLGGGAALADGRAAEAASLWERLLPKLEPGGEDARMVEANIAMARQRAGGKAGAGAGVSTKKAAPDASAKTAAAGKSVTGRVELAPALRGKVAADDVVFVFARAVDGPRMPLAAKKLRIADLPAEFVLDDRNSLGAGAPTISSAKNVRIEARVSKSGTATPGPGDLTGQSAPVAPGAKGVRVVIDTATP